MTVAKHHEHPSHSYERLELFEELVGKLAVPLALVLGAAMAVGLLTATGHVYW